MNKQAPRIRLRIAPAVWMIIFFAFSAGPALYPLMGGLIRAAHGKVWSGDRLIPLAIRSAGLASFSAAAASVLGAGFAIWLVSGAGRLRKAARALYLVPLLLPPYLTALTWMAIFSGDGAVSSFCRAALGFHLTPYGFWGTGIILAMVFSPIATWMTIQSIESMDAGPAEAGLVMAGDRATWRRGLLPGLAPTVTASAALVFALVLAEYGVPALLQYNVFSMEVFAEYSRSGDPAMAAALALPMAIPALLACGAAVFSGHILPSKGPADGTRPKLSATNPPPEIKLLGAACFVSFALALAVPISVLVWQSFSGGHPVQAVAGGLVPLAFSFPLAIFSGILAAGLAAPAAWAFDRSGSRLLLALCLIPLALPAPLAGIGLVEISASPWLRWAASGPWLLALGHAIRFLPVAALVQADFWRCADPLPWDAARLAPAAETRKLALIWIPMALPGMAVSAGLAAAFSLGEIAISVLLCPPGFQTAALRLFNLLHYGADASVASLALAAMAAAALAGTMAWLLVFRRRRN